MTSQQTADITEINFAPFCLFNDIVPSYKVSNDKHFWFRNYGGGGIRHPALESHEKHSFNRVKHQCALQANQTGDQAFSKLSK